MIEKTTRKSMKIRHSGRSSDYISPSFGFGCLYRCAYCTMRRHKKQGVSIATNTDDILRAIAGHLSKQPPKDIYIAMLEKKGDYKQAQSLLQTHAARWTYDISCNEDFCLHLKHHDWKRIFDFFKERPNVMATMATKYVNRELLTYSPEGKVRVRLSLMPQINSYILEPNTSLIEDRIKFVNELAKAGYSVHLNFSPIVTFANWLEHYRELFLMIDSIIEGKHKPNVLAECIFLTHNNKMHEYNLEHAPEAETLLWNQPFEEKTSQLGGKNLRYPHRTKASYIRRFTALHDELIPWNRIRYIF